MKLTNTQIIRYLVDVLGYEELMIDEIKDNYRGALIECLDIREVEECIDYNM